MTERDRGGRPPLPQPGAHASYTGTAPIDVSSGGHEHHRLSRRGNRQLSAAIHVIAVTQARDPGPGRDHYQRKLAETKTANEARRSLKRRLSNVIYRRLRADQKRLEQAGMSRPKTDVDQGVLHAQIPICG